MNMKKAPNTNKLKYVGAALLEGESVTLIQAARLVLEIVKDMLLLMFSLNRPENQSF